VSSGQRVLAVIQRQRLAGCPYSCCTRKKANNAWGCSLWLARLQRLPQHHTNVHSSWHGPSASHPLPGDYHMCTPPSTAPSRAPGARPPHLAVNGDGGKGAVGVGQVGGPWPAPGGPLVRGGAHVCLACREERHRGGWLQWHAYKPGAAALRPGPAQLPGQSQQAQHHKAALWRPAPRR